MDFAKGANPPREVASTVPKFRMVRSKPRRTVLVLDVSASMLPFINDEKADRLLKLRQVRFEYPALEEIGICLNRVSVYLRFQTLSH